MLTLAHQATRAAPCLVLILPKFFHDFTIYTIGHGRSERRDPAGQITV